MYQYVDKELENTEEVEYKPNNEEDGFKYWFITTGSTWAASFLLFLIQTAKGLDLLELKLSSLLATLCAFTIGQLVIIPCLIMYKRSKGQKKAPSIVIALIVAVIGAVLVEFLKPLVSVFSFFAIFGMLLGLL